MKTFFFRKDGQVPHTVILIDTIHLKKSSGFLTNVEKFQCWPYVRFYVFVFFFYYLISLIRNSGDYISVPSSVNNLPGILIREFHGLI